MFAVKKKTKNVKIMYQLNSFCFEFSDIFAAFFSNIRIQFFRLNILYSDPSPINYLIPVDKAIWPEQMKDRILLNTFNLDKLNFYQVLGSPHLGEPRPRALGLQPSSFPQLSDLLFQVFPYLVGNSF